VGVLPPSPVAVGEPSPDAAPVGPIWVVAAAGGRDLSLPARSRLGGGQLPPRYFQPVAASGARASAPLLSIRLEPTASSADPVILGPDPAVQWLRRRCLAGGGGRSVRSPPLHPARTDGLFAGASPRRGAPPWPKYVGGGGGIHAPTVGLIRDEAHHGGGGPDLGISGLDPPAAAPYCPLLGAGGAPAMQTRAGVASGRGHFPRRRLGVDLDSRAPDGDGSVGTGHLDKPSNPPSHRPRRSQAARKSTPTSTSMDIIAPVSVVSLHLVKTLPIISSIFVCRFGFVVPCRILEPGFFYQPPDFYRSGAVRVATAVYR
jgi:hypothetical protein